MEDLETVPWVLLGLVLGVAVDVVVVVVVVVDAVAVADFSVPFTGSEGSSGGDMVWYGLL